MTAGVLIVVFVFSLVIYVHTKNFGEAALALVGGVFAAYSINWTPPAFWAFTFIWVTFVLLVFLIESVKLAARLEDLVRSSALKLSNTGLSFEESISYLSKIVKQQNIGTLGQIERAEIVQAFCYRGVQHQVVGEALSTVEKLHLVTDLPYLSLANAVADIYRVPAVSGDVEEGNLADLIYENVRNCFAAPRDFLEAVSTSRHLLLSQSYNIESFLNEVRSALDRGIAPGNVSTELELMSKKVS